MSNLDKILQHNQEFVKSKKYVEFKTTKFPDKRMVILTCMDTRLSDLLPKAMNVGQGDAKIIKNAGAIVSHPFGSIMRSILVAVYSLKADEVFVVGHEDCGMTGLQSGPILEKAIENSVPEEHINILRNAGINIDSWLKGFESVDIGVKESVAIIQNHPLMPENVPVHGLIIHPETGELKLLVDGHKYLNSKGKS